MDKRQLEDKVYGLIDRVTQGQRIEDTTIELKREWLDFEKAARRLAGLANAARGEQVLWIVGLDEDNSQIIGADERDLANWLPSVDKYFQGATLQLALSVSVSIGEKYVVALLFDTDQSPYVVRNPTFGKPNGGPVQYEVPWREGTSVRTAKRQDLLKMLIKAAKRPTVEVRWAEMTHAVHADGIERWALTVELYASPQDDKPVTFASHQWSCEFYHAYTLMYQPMEIRTVGVTESVEGSVNGDRVTFTRPIKFQMTALTTFRHVTMSLPDEVKAKIVFHIPGEDSLTVSVELDLEKQSVDNGTVFWRQGAQRVPPKRMTLSEMAGCYS